MRFLNMQAEKGQMSYHTQSIDKDGSRAYFHHFGTMAHTPGIGNFSA